MSPKKIREWAVSLRNQVTLPTIREEPSQTHSPNVDRYLNVDNAISLNENSRPETRLTRESPIGGEILTQFSNDHSRNRNLTTGPPPPITTYSSPHLMTDTTTAPTYTGTVSRTMTDEVPVREKYHNRSREQINRNFRETDRTIEQKLK